MRGTYGWAGVSVRRGRRICLIRPQENACNVGDGTCDLRVHRRRPKCNSATAECRRFRGSLHGWVPTRKLLDSRQHHAEEPGGGAAQEVLRQTGIFNIQCARIPSRLCLFNTQVAGTTTFFSFDPEHGKGHEVARMTETGEGANCVRSST